MLEAFSLQPGNRAFLELVPAFRWEEKSTVFGGGAGAQRRAARRLPLVGRLRARALGVLRRAECWWVEMGRGLCLPRAVGRRRGTVAPVRRGGMLANSVDSQAAAGLSSVAASASTARRCAQLRGREPPVRLPLCAVQISRRGRPGRAAHAAGAVRRRGAAHQGARVGRERLRGLPAAAAAAF